MVYKTPGVYVQEISLFPPSVAEVATAIPAFIGYTEKAMKDGESVLNKPTRITSFLEYQQYFGGDSTPKVSGSVDSNYAVSVTVDRCYMFETLRLFFDNGGGPCYIVAIGDYDALPAQQPFSDAIAALEKFDEPTMILMPDAVRLEPAKMGSLQQLVLAQCGKLKDRVGVFDLPYPVLKADKSAKKLADTDFVETVRNGFGANDLKYGAAYGPWITTSYDKDVSLATLKGLKMGAGTFDPTILFPSNSVEQGEIQNLVTQIEMQAGKAAGTAPAPAPQPGADATADKQAVDAAVQALAAPDATLKEHFDKAREAVDDAADAAVAASAFKEFVDFVRSVAVGMVTFRDLKTEALLDQVNAAAVTQLRPAVDALVGMEKNTEVEKLLDAARTDDNVVEDYAIYDDEKLIGTWISRAPADTAEFPKHYANDADGDAVAKEQQAKDIAADVAPIFNALDRFVAAVQKAADDATKPVDVPKQDDEAAKQKAADEVKRLQQTLYTRFPVIGNMVRQIKIKMSEVPPGGAVAGVYAYIDSTRGVWKAPANVSLSQVLGPVELIDDATQENLNVDVVGGKSINVIRSFSGRGTLIWGGRTLAGNDNEWRYVNVRRFFNMVEESVKKSTFWAVFEPNSAPLWVKVKGMIENYLIEKWRDGALAGARPEDAFFVKVGLGQTMTAQDILEGRLNVEIGMAVVRPAEFIVLKFSHMLQKS